VNFVTSLCPLWLIFFAASPRWVYSKRPGHNAELNRPYTYKKWDTLLDIAKYLKFVRVWGKQAFDGQGINKDYILQDKDIIELHHSW